jgi:hypothetical protein
MKRTRRQTTCACCSGVVSAGYQSTLPKRRKVMVETPNLSNTLETPKSNVDFLTGIFADESQNIPASESQHPIRIESPVAESGSTSANIGSDDDRFGILFEDVCFRESNLPKHDVEIRLTSIMHSSPKLCKSR